MILQYVTKLIFIMLIFIAYYKYGKLLIIRHADKVARYFKLTCYFPLDDIKGTIELAMIALSHVVFCLLLLTIFPVTDFFTLSLKIGALPIYLIYGILIGIGCMGISALCCQIAIQIIRFFQKDNQYDLKSWLTVGRGGWIKHHLQSMEILPFYFSLIVLTMQVGSEEIIFRAILLNYFAPFGKMVALLTACSLFIFMQAFLTHRWQTAIFPMIGATVMGIVHSILYLQMPMIFTLIVAHVTFFIFSVI